MPHQLRSGAAEGVSSERVLEFARLFGDELTLDNLNSMQLRSLCRFMNLYGACSAGGGRRRWMASARTQ